MALATDLTYIRLLSPRLDKFTQKGDYLFNCRCPICGDSKKNKNKARGYFYRKTNDFFFNCKNCGLSTTLGNLIKVVSPQLYQEYIMERWKNGETGHSNYQKPVFKIDPPKFDKVTKRKSFDNAEPLSALPKGHFALNYVEGRMIPKEFYDDLFYTDNYRALMDELYPDHGKDLVPDKRLVIPFYDEFNELIGVSGRALETADVKLRYVTLRIKSEGRLTFGLDRVDKNKKIFVVEGPLDSLFLPNCLAAGDSALIQVAEELGEQCEFVLIYDNENRNKEICKLIRMAIRNGFPVCIWPQYVEHKDINEMVMNDMDPKLIERIIDTNTFKGPMAELHFNQWKRT